MNGGPEFVDVAIPFVVIGNHQVLTDVQVEREPWLMDFIKSFANCFERNDALCCFVFYPGGKPRR